MHVVRAAPAIRIECTDQQMTGRLRGCVLPMREVDVETADKLFAIFCRHYVHVDRATFDRDQAEKQWVLLLSDDGGEIRGFTTMVLYDLRFEGRPIRVVFSGNTIVDRDYWGEQTLVRSFGRFMAKVKSQEPSVPLYWYLICSGHRTYRYLSLFYREFYPCYDAATPPRTQKLIDGLGRLKFADEYHDGIIRVSQPRECLRPELAVPTEDRTKNPHVRFFVERNPGYVRGDELVCVAEYSLDNLRGQARRTAQEVLAANTSPA